MLFLDADGSTPIKELEKLTESIKEHKLAIACGSRGMAESKVEKSLYRSILSFVFHLLLWGLLGLKMSDTQCGFKLMTREAVNRVIPRCTVPGWAFDVELVALCQSSDIVIKEIPVEWREKPGSKLSPVRDSILMVLDILKIGLLIDC